MAPYIVNKGTFCLNTLDQKSYTEEIDKIRTTFPEFPLDPNFRVVHPNFKRDEPDSYYSLTFEVDRCSPILGVYQAKSVYMTGVIVDDVVYKLKEYDVPKSVIPLHQYDLKMGGGYPDLEDGNPVHFSKQHLINAVRTLSKGYDCNDRRRYKKAVLQLITMSSEALRFEEIKQHMARGFEYEYYEEHPLTPRLKAFRGNWGKMSQSVWENQSSFSCTCSNGEEITIERDKMASVLSLLNTKKRDPDLLLQLLTSPDVNKRFGASSKRGNLSGSSPSKQAQLHSDPSGCRISDTIGMSRMTSYVKQNVGGFGSSSKRGNLSSSSPSKPAQLHSDPSGCFRSDTIGMSTGRMTSYVKQIVGATSHFSSSSPPKQAQLHSDPGGCLKSDTVGMSTASRITSYVKQNVGGVKASTTNWGELSRLIRKVIR